MSMTAIKTLVHTPIVLRKSHARIRPVQCKTVRAMATAVLEGAGRQTKKDALADARADVEALIKSKHCNPIIVRLA